MWFSIDTRNRKGNSSREAGWRLLTITMPDVARRLLTRVWFVALFVTSSGAFCAPATAQTKPVVSKIAVTAKGAGRGEPPAQAMQVIKLIAGHRLPISMSTKPDFSDVLLPDGSTRPR